MATILRPSAPCALDRIEVRRPAVAGPLAAFAAIAAAGSRHAYDGLARLIDVALMAVFLLGDAALAASLGCMIAGQVAG